VIREIRVVMLALAIVAGIGHVYVTGLILAIGTIVLTLWDVDVEGRGHAHRRRWFE
jgi:hypothetical protein